MKINANDLNVIKKIIGKLEDNESKEIYTYRLLYSLTNDIRYIYDMIGVLAQKNKKDIIKKSKEAQSMFKLYKECDLYSFLLENFQKSDGSISRKNIRDTISINARLWDENKTLYVTRGGDDGTRSRVKDIGNEKADVVSLDTLLDGDKVTYIKMDIEGSELKALEGAKILLRYINLSWQYVFIIKRKILSHCLSIS